MKVVIAIDSSPASQYVLDKAAVALGHGERRSAF